MLKTILDFLPTLASIVLLVFGLIALVTQDVRKSLGKTWSKILFIVLCLIGAGGAISSFMQDTAERARQVGEATGGETFCYLTAATNQGAGDPPTFPLSVVVVGDYPMRLVSAKIQTNDFDSHLKSIEQISLGGSDLPPGYHSLSNIRIPLGRHIITVWSRRGMINEQLTLSKSDDGTVKMSGDVMRDGKMLLQVP
jgi:hypothetical protein